MEKRIFDLDVKDGWPPVAAESLWLDATDIGYRVKTIPFFIRDIAYDDTIDIRKMRDSRAKIRRVVRSSGNSTIWTYFSPKFEYDRILEGLSKAGIGFEGGGVRRYFAINLPRGVPLETFDAIMMPAEEARLVEIVYGAMRHSTQ